MFVYSLSLRFSTFHFRYDIEPNHHLITLIQWGLCELYASVLNTENLQGEDVISSRYDIAFNGYKKPLMCRSLGE